MNFLSFLTSGLQLFNSNLQNQPTKEKNNLFHSGHSLQTFPQKNQGFKKVSDQVNDKEMTDLSTTSNKLFQQLLASEQQLILSQYMHMNLQLIQNKIQNKNLQDQEHSSSKASLKKKKKKIITCGHHDKEHYAKGLCNNCYHKHGRVKKPWNCTHEVLYAAGLCQNCYINQYNKKKRGQKGPDIKQSQE